MAKRKPELRTSLSRRLASPPPPRSPCRCSAALSGSCRTANFIFYSKIFLKCRKYSLILIPYFLLPSDDSFKNDNKDILEHIFSSDKFCELEKETLNEEGKFAKGETSKAITPYHFFKCLNFLGFYH